MGIEYKRYLIPQARDFRPGASETLALIDGLRHDGWLLAEGSDALKRLPFAGSSLYESARGRGYYARTVGTDGSFGGPLADLLNSFEDRDLVLAWPVESLGMSSLRYPLDPLPFEDASDAQDCYYEIQLHFARDYIYHVSEVIDPFVPEPTCPRGHALELPPDADEDPFYASRLAKNCPECGARFDPTTLVASGRNGWTGDDIDLPGGAAYRFAIVVDCGKFFAQRPPRFHPELRVLVERTLGKPLHEVEDFY